MARNVQLESNKTYANEANAIKAVQDKYGDTDIRFTIVYNKEGRCYPILFGQEALDHQTWFSFVTVA